MYDEVYWPNCKSDVVEWVFNRLNHVHFGCAALTQLLVGATLVIVAIDILELPETESGNQYVLVYCDYHEIKWVETYPVREWSALSVADVCQLCAPKQG